MENKSEDQGSVFHRAWELIVNDTSIPSEEKKGVLKLIQVLIEATEFFLLSTRKVQPG